MNMHADKTQHDKHQSLANQGIQKRSRDHSTFQFVDDQPALIAQRRLQAMADNSAQAKQLKALQQMTTARPIQRFKNVTLETDDDDKKSLSAVGTVKDFKGGTGPGSRGWVGVTKYRAWYEINSVDGKYRDAGDVGPYQNTFTNPEAGHVLAKQNGGNGGDPENIFAQDGGTNNSKYKIFENDMRNKLDRYNDKDKVAFKCYLAGDDIEEGVIADQGLSDASDISSDEDSV